MRTREEECHSGAEKEETFLLVKGGRGEESS